MSVAMIEKYAVPGKGYCKHGDVRLVRQAVGSRGVIQYKYQCFICGVAGGFIAHAALSDGERAAAVPYNDDIRSERLARWRQERDAERDEQDRQFWAAYNAYLRSPEWHARRGAVLRRDGYICQACLQSPAVQVHHTTYKHWGNEPLFELVSVCRECHDQITALDRAQE